MTSASRKKTLPAAPVTAGAGTPAQAAAAKKRPVIHAPDENLILGYMKENKVFLLILLAAVLIGGTLQQILPKMRQEKLASSWEQFRRTVNQNGLVALSAEGLPETLAELRGDDRIFPFVVIRAAAEALSRGDKEALALLKPELEALQGKVSGFQIYGTAGTMGEVEYLLERVNAEMTGSAPDFVNQTPTGRKVKISLKIGDTDTYDLVFGLYEDAAPEAVQRFLAAVEAGWLTTQKGEFAGRYNLRFHGLTDPEAPEGVEADPLPLEIRHGIYHQAGALATVQAGVGSDPGSQDPDTMALFLDKATFFDGRATVFGFLVDGDAGLSALKGLSPDPNAPTQPNRSVEIVSIEVLP